MGKYEEACRIAESLGARLMPSDWLVRADHIPITAEECRRLLEGVSLSDAVLENRGRGGNTP